MELKPLNPNVIKLWRVLALVIALPMVIAVLVAGSLLQLPVLVPAFLALALLIGASVVPRLAYRRWRYAIRELDLYTSRGAVWHVETLVPFDRIQFVESRQGPLDRAFQLTQVIVYTAAGRASNIPGLDEGTAESIREDLSKVAGTTSV